MKYSNEELEKAFLEINKNANPWLAFFGALIGAVPGLAIYIIYDAMGGILYIMLALSPMIVGFFAKFVGRTYTIKHRLSVGIVGSLVHIAGCYYLQFSPLLYVLTPTAFAISFTLSKVKLDKRQSWAVSSFEFGKMDNN